MTDVLARIINLVLSLGLVATGVFLNYVFPLILTVRAFRSHRDSWGIALIVGLILGVGVIVALFAYKPVNYTYRNMERMKLGLPPKPEPPFWPWLWKVIKMVGVFIGVTVGAFFAFQVGHFFLYIAFGALMAIGDSLSTRGHNVLFIISRVLCVGMGIYLIGFGLLVAGVIGWEKAGEIGGYLAEPSPPPMILACCFAAVSTEEQAKSGMPSLDDQLAVCRRACDLYGWTVAHTIRIEGHSRYYTRLDKLVRDCPEFAELLDIIENAKVRVVVAAAYDRFWRTDALRAQLCAIAQESAVRLFSCAQPVPLDADETALWAQLMGGITAQGYIEAIQRNYRRGMPARVQVKGLYPLGPCPYGLGRADRDKPKELRADKGKPLELIESEAVWMRYAFEGIAGGKSLLRVALDMNDLGSLTRKGYPWTPDTLWTCLRSPIYAGGVRLREWRKTPQSKVLQREILNWDTPQPKIVSRELWDTVQLMLSSRRHWTQANDARADFPLRGLLRCGYCGRSMVLVSPGRVRCNRYNSSGGKECRPNNFHRCEIEQTVLLGVQDALRNPDLWIAQQGKSLDANVTERDALAAGVADLDRRIKNVYTAIQSGHFTGGLSDLATIYDDLCIQKHQTETRLAALDTKSGGLERLHTTLVTQAGAVDSLAAMPPADLNAFYRRILLAIRVQQEEPQVILDPLR